MEIRSRAFLVTGGTRGIGRALVATLLEEGARVSFSGRDAKRVAAARKACSKPGAEAIGTAADVGSDADCRQLVQATLDGFGAIDVLINNAAILAPRATVVETPARVWEEVLRVNVIGTANMIRHVLPHMEQRGRGIIINLSSGWGREASGHVASYCASKFAVEALTQSVSEETGRGIVVFALNPGVIATDMLRTAFGGDVSSYPAPERLGPRWLKLLRSVDRSWHGSSRDLSDY